MGWWIATEFGPLAREVEALWIEADDEQQAASVAAEHFDELARGEREAPSHIHLIWADWTLWRLRVVADKETGALACCGGLGDGRHTGHCPNGRGEA